MPVNIGPRIGIEGEDQYRKQIMDCVQSTKTLEAQMKALESTSDKEADAQEKAAKKAELLAKKQEEQKKRVEALKKMVEESAKKYGENSRETNRWKEALANAEIEANKLGDEVGQLDKNMQTFSDAAVMAARTNIAEFFEKAGEAAQKLASAAYDAAKELDEGYDTIVKKTGATGDELGKLQDVADDVFSSMPVEMADVGKAVGELNTRFNLTGDELADTSRTFLKFANVTDTDVNTAISSSAKVMKAFGTDVKDADKFLGYLAKQAQDTGVDSRQLLSSLEQNGATLREMGIGLQESVKLLASFEENGVDASAAMTGFKKAIANGAKEGKSANEVIEEMVSGIKNAKDDTAALAKATELFGTRGAAVMADGIRSGRISLDDLTESMEQYEAKVAMNNAKIAGKELAGEALATIAPLIEKVTDGIKSATEWFRNLPEPVKKVVGVVGLLSAGLAVVGPKILSVVNTIKSLKAATAVLNSAKGAMDGVKGSAGGLNGEFGKTAGLVTAIVAAYGALNYALTEWELKDNEWYQQVKKDIAALEELERSAKSYADEVEKTRAEEEAEAKQIADLTDEFLQLNKKSKLTTDEQKRYKQIVGQLNNILPDFSDEIDESTGKLKDQSQASNDAIDELANNKRAIDAVDKLAKAQDDLTQRTNEYIQAEQIASKYAEAFGITTDELAEKTSKVEVQSNKVVKIFGTSLQKVLNDTALVIDEAGDAVAEYGDAVETAQEEVDKYSDAAEDAVEVTDEFGNVVTESADDVEDGFAEILKATKENLQKSITYLDEWADSGENSLDKMAEQMQKNARDMANWSKNVQTITSDARYGMDRNFTAAVDMLIAQGGKGATAVAQFADAMKSGNTQVVNAFLTGYNGVSTQATQIENRIGNLQANAKAKLDGVATVAKDGVKDIASGMEASKPLVEKAARAIAEAQELAKVSTSTAKTWGADAIKALAAGMQSEDWRVRKQADIIAQDVKDRLGHSTPKLGPLHGDDQWGYHLVDNIAKGMEASLPKLENAALQTAYAALPTMSMPGGNTTTNSLTYGDIVVNVRGAGVQNEELLARKISDNIFRQVRAQKAVWA